MLGGGAWGAIDQAIYSLTNFALAILVARAVTPDEFGAFSLIFVGYLVTQGVAEAVTGETFAVAHSTANDRRGIATKLAEAAGCALGLGLALGAVVAVLGLLTSGLVAGLLHVFALVLPGLLLQNLWRFAFFATNRPRAAVLNDLVWALAQTIAVVVITATGRSSLNSLILAWGGAGTLAALLGALQAQVVPDPLRSGAWLARHRTLSLRFAGEFVVLSGTGYLVQPFLGVVSGLAELAKLRAALVIIGPLHALRNAVRISLTPLGVRLARTERHRLPNLAVCISVGLGGLAGAWSLAVLSLPDSFGRALLGASWAGTREVMPAVAVHIVAMGMGSGALIGLRSMAAARRSLRARLVIAVLQLAFGMGGATLAQGLGAAAGLAAANVVGIGLLWDQFRRAYQEGDGVEGGGQELLDETETFTPLG